MRKQFRQNYVEGSKKEEKKFYEFKAQPKMTQYYSSRVSPTQKHISTEIYKESYQMPRNIQRSNEFYNYAEYTPYHQTNQNSSEKNYFSKNETYYTSSKKNMGNNFNNFKNFSPDLGEGMYTSFKKKMIFGNTDLRNQYSPPTDARVNIRKKLIEERDINYQTDANGNLLENFQYYEINNSRNNSAQKYDSITRVIGYSNLIPLHTRKMMKNFSNVDINKNGKYNKKEEYNYNKKVETNYLIKKDVNIVQQNQKKEFKKPAQLNTVKKTEIVKKYEIKKQPEVKKVEENKYKKYERKKEETVKKEVKKEVKSVEKAKKTEIKLKEKKEEKKKEVKEPIIIKRKENFKATFSTHSGRYKCTGNIANDIITSRKNYNANSQERNIKKVEIVQKSSKSEKKSEKKVENKVKINTEIKAQNSVKKKEEPKPVVKRSEIVKKEVKKITTNVKPVERKEVTNIAKKVNVSENMTNYRKKKEEVKKVEQKPKINYTKNINIKTESYGKIDESKYRRQNIDIGNMINIKEIERIYEMKRKKRNVTPKMKTKTINLGDNYKYYERKCMQSPDENYLIIHQRRNQRVIYGEQILESNGVKKMKMYKSKPYIMEERYNSQIINNSQNPCYRDNENYIMTNKYYESSYNKGNRNRIYDDEDGLYYSEQGGSYYY